MEVLVGLVGRDFVLVGGDTSVIRSITVLKSTEAKARQLNKHNVLYYSGEAGDTVHFAEYIQKNSQLFHFTNNGQDLNTPQMAAFIRRQLAESLRSRNPFQVNILLGGWSEEHGPKLYWQDYMASSASVPYAAQGYGSYYLTSLLDRYHTNDMDLNSAVEIMKKCLHELKTRFIVNLPAFHFQVIDAQGIRDIEISI